MMLQHAHCPTGNLAYLESEVVTFPEVSFLIEPENVVKVEAENPNGQADDYPSNNMYENTMDEAQNVVGPVTLIMLLGSNPEEITWEVKNSQGSVLYEGGPYTGSPPSVIQQFNLTDPDCYSFIIYDEGGDGLTGGGVYKLYDGNNSIFMQNNSYGFQDHIQFGLGMTSTNETELSQGFEVFPNPIEDKATINFVMDKPGEVYYRVYGSTGTIVSTFEQRSIASGSHTMTLETGNLSQGMYIIEFHAGEKVYTKQIVIVK
ncbi:MAG: T9SS type A sorting domain-containing protein [Bacteroidales bacterium]